MRALMATGSLIILIVLTLLGSWTLTMVTMFALIPFMATKLYSSILSPKFALYFQGGDNLSWGLVLLTLWVGALALMSRTYIRHMYREYTTFLRLMLILFIVLYLAFTVTNLLVFYILFEAALIPIMIIIVVWGRRPERIQAGLYIIIYTVSASLPLLVSLLIVHYTKGTLFIYFSVGEMPPLLLFVMSIAFLVKFPVYGLHLWLPKAHVEAPVGGSMILAGLLLKLGPYGIIRLIRMFYNYHLLSPLFISWGLLRRVSAAIVCLRQIDIKALVAYASIRHMGMVLAGMITYTSTGYSGAVFILVGHGLASSGLFALVWFVYEWTKSRSLLVNRGLHHVAPALSLFWFLMIAANIGVPPSLTIAAEVHLFAGLAAIAGEPPITYGILVVYSVLTIGYSLNLFTSLNHGEVSPHVNFLWQRPIYYSISLLHLAPLVLRFLALPMLI